MKRGLKNVLGLFAAAVTVMFNSCMQADPGTVTDQNAVIENLNWLYNDKIKAEVNINDVKPGYNLYLNLRVTADYRYSNLFILVHQTSPGKKTWTTRYEFKLANADGEWLGNGSGNLYTYQVPFKLNYHFPTKGIYHIELEQNMRDNPLREISDVGLRVEKAE